jgi:uncharacterized protein (TIGR02246 family)
VTEVSAERAAQARDEIRAVLATQQRAWRAGELDALLDTYCPSGDVRYAGGPQVVRGIAQLRRRFASVYRDPTELGRLEFSGVEITVLTEQDALAFGEWTIRSDSAGAQVQRGVFTLHLRRTGRGWLVLSDHTSAVV